MKRGYPREKSTYRADRRNHSILNRDRKNWYGVEAKPAKDQPPPLVLKVSKRGETFYTPLWL